MGKMISKQLLFIGVNANLSVYQIMDLASPVAKDKQTTDRAEFTEVSTGGLSGLKAPPYL
jgi:hypothetical protein